MKKTGWLIGIAISVALLFFLFFGIDYRQFLRALQGARYWYAVPIIGLLFLGCYLRALRWRWIMLPVKPIPVYHLFTAVVIGYMANDLLPARAGELVRAHVVGSRDKVSRATAFATIVVERLFDGLSVLVVMVLVLFRVRVPV